MTKHIMIETLWLWLPLSYALQSFIIVMLSFNCNWYILFHFSCAQVFTYKEVLIYTWWKLWWQFFMTSGQGIYWGRKRCTPRGVESCWYWYFKFLSVANCQACCILGNIFLFSFFLSTGKVVCLCSAKFLIVYIYELAMRIG